MNRIIQLLVLVTLPILQACTLNGTRLLKGEITSPVKNSSVVIYGIGLEAKWDHPKLTMLSVTLDEYDIKKQAITGGCMRYNRTSAGIKSIKGPVKYFSFKVRPGHYVYSGFNRASFDRSKAFTILSGQVIYLGDFIFKGANRVKLRHDYMAMQTAISKSSPNLNKKIIQAKRVTVRPPAMFLCMI